MFHLKANHQHQQTSNSILEKLIGQVARDDRKGRGGRRAGCSIQSRLADHSNRFKRRLDRLQWAGLKSNLEKSLSRLVQSAKGHPGATRQAACGRASETQPIASQAAKNVLVERKRRDDENSGEPAATRLPYGCRPNLRRTASLGQRKLATTITPTSTTTTTTTTMKPVARGGPQAKLGSSKILIERNVWGSRSVREQAGNCADKPRSAARLTVGGLLGGTRSKPVSRCSSTKRSARASTPLLMLVAASLSQFLMILVLVAAVVSRNPVEMAPIWPVTSSLASGQGRGDFETPARPLEVTNLFGVKLDDDIARELNDRLAMIYSRGEPDDDKSQPDWTTPAGEAAGKAGPGELAQRRAEPEEYLWIERRRLNRDRILEPPAWLRTRPIRGDSARQLATDKINRDDGNDREEAAQASRPIQPATGRNRNRNRSSRQLRDSNQAGLYDELLNQLIGGSLEAGKLLEDLQDEMEERTRSRGRPLAQDGQSLSNLGLTRDSSKFQQGQQKQQQQAAAAAALVGANQAEQLIVAGDEVSDSDDTTLVPVDVGSVAQQEQQQQQQGQSSSLVSLGQVSPEATPSEDKQQAGRADFVLISPVAIQNGPQMVSAGQQLGPAEATGASPATSDNLVKGTAHLDGTAHEAALLELIPIASQMEQQQQAQQEESFHVLEDIDQIDGGRETSPSPTGSGDTRDTAIRMPMAKRSPNRHPNWIRRTFGRGSPSFANANDDSDLAGGTPAETIQAEPVASDRMAAAMRLFSAGFFSREELLKIATELKYHLEHALNLPRGSIRALFPINRRQILVELVRTKLNSVDRFNLAQEFGYSESTSSMTLDLSDRLHTDTSNPLPLLAVILDKINGYQEEDSDGRTMTNGAGRRDTRRGELRETPLEESGAVQINEPLGRPLALRRQQPSVANDAGEDEDELVSDYDETMDEADFDDEVGKNGRQLALPEGDFKPAPFRSQAAAPSFFWLQPQTMSPSSPNAIHWAQPLQMANSYGTAAGYKQILLRPPASSWPAVVLPSWQQQIAEPRMQSQAALVSLMSAIYGNRPKQQQLLSDTLSRLSDDQLEMLAARLATVQDFLHPVAPVASAVQNPTPSGSNSILERFGLGGRNSEYHVTTTFWLVLICILIGIVLIIVLTRLIMRRLDKVVNSSRRLSNLSSFSCSTVSSKARLWAPFRGKRGPHSSACAAAAEQGDACGTIQGEHTSCASRAPDLQRAPLRKRGLSADSGLETIDGATTATCGEAGAGNSSERLRKSLDLLAARLSRFISFTRSQDQDLSATTLTSGVVSSELEDTVTSTNSQQQPEQRFRTSTSYIRSLIEALTKAANVQMAASVSGGDLKAAYAQGEQDDDDDDGDDHHHLLEDGEAGQEDDEDDKFDGGAPNLIGRRDRGRRRRISTSQQEQKPASAQRNLFVEDQNEILMSQMDISAAHLILDYMERHLVDKEMLRREWQELNATPPSSRSLSPANSKAAGRGQLGLVLQRLARVALQEENQAKNRNLKVVPFDKNRVKLGRPKRGAGAQQSGESARPEGLVEAGGRRASSRGRGGGSPRLDGDYINASFIYDDDPRRPTHIIAQGPTESTCGQFWQMIWEQQVSLIVMLTRLNENGNQMCYCYWPTSVAQQTTGTNGNGKAGSVSPPPTATMAARRGSVTSVFNGSKPIVAGTEVTGTNNNVLCFELPAFTLEVQLISEHVSSSDYLVRNMYLINRNSGETRTISQFHYLAWLESGTPENVRSFLQFRRKIHKSYRNSNNPILVHCSDGAGRSGTYTLIDMILERIRNGAKEIDLRATLEHLRDQRPALCSSQEQFEFALVALAEEIQIILNALPQ